VLELVDFNTGQEKTKPSSEKGAKKRKAKEEKAGAKPKES
jgi:hypothetical protein